MSAYIKSIDSNHLVALGDEGFYNEPSAATYPYQYVFIFISTKQILNLVYYRGSEGVDFNANLAISTLDFGTFHVCVLSATDRLMRLISYIESRIRLAGDKVVMS